MNNKTCTSCGNSFPADTEHFPPDNSSPDGLRSQCRECKRAKDRERDERNKRTQPSEQAEVPSEQALSDFFAEEATAPDCTTAAGAGIEIDFSEQVQPMPLAVSQDTGTALVMHAIDVAEAKVQALIHSLPSLTDDEVIEFGKKAAELERAAFRIRGACAFEIKHRVARRLDGGRGNKDKECIGIKAMLGNVAAEWGIDRGVMEQDLHIYEVFHDAGSFDNPRLGREHFRFAASAPDPIKAIELAESKLDQPGFTVKQFRLDVAALKGLRDESKETQEQAADALENGYWLNVQVSQECKSNVIALAKLWDEPSWSSTIERAIRETLQYEKQERG